MSPHSYRAPRGRASACRKREARIVFSSCRRAGPDRSNGGRLKCRVRRPSLPQPRLRAIGASTAAIEIDRDQAEQKVEPEEYVDRLTAVATKSDQRVRTVKIKTAVGHRRSYHGPPHSADAAWAFSLTSATTNGLDGFCPSWILFCLTARSGTWRAAGAAATLRFGPTARISSPDASTKPASEPGLRVSFWLCDCCMLSSERRPARRRSDS